VSGDRRQKSEDRGFRDLRIEGFRDSGIKELKNLKIKIRNAELLNTKH
jgi:hypothetical protein